MNESSPSTATTQEAMQRTVFIISDGTGITAETFSHSVLSQFENVPFKQVRVPFVDTLEKADAVIERINHIASTKEGQPIAFTTLVDPVLSARVKTANALFWIYLPALSSRLSNTSGCPLATRSENLTRVAARRSIGIGLTPSTTACHTTMVSL